MTTSGCIRGAIRSACSPEPTAAASSPGAPGGSATSVLRMRGCERLAEQLRADDLPVHLHERAVRLVREPACAMPVTTSG